MSKVNVTFVDPPIFKNGLMTFRGDAFYRDDLRPGNARWNYYDSGAPQFSYCCPCGCGMVNLIRTYTGEPRGPNGDGWHWDGNLLQPTLSPSLQHLSKCRWHGHVIKGEFVSA